MNIGETIAQFREKQGMTQRQLADKIGVHYSIVSCWESGKRKPRYKSIVKISELLSIPIFELSDTEKVTINTEKPNVEIREAMKQAGVAQWELSDLFGCSENTVYRKFRKELSAQEKERIIEFINNRKEYTTVAAKVECILCFPSETKANAWCEKQRSNDKDFELLDYDNTPTDDNPDAYTIRVQYSYKGCPMLVSSMTIDNDPTI